ncbi:MAG: hypothetical protein A2150_00480 [Candidatus Muproteobacteria bacterium RBG_16_64_11]|uniref:Uncharacterized protein n=1 Tax=Candidatus Muproteobacteria bacterium RBG_16_64_11 TaxID=1817758 RepID=A0A1F6T9V5_9PROT|nr:MAG: hypothetical protein A2150_00480 [Candidatus Muproteobacteria bacterium RBG_16_64_11]
MMTKRNEILTQRIKRERRELNLAPWQFAPSEVDAGKCPYPVHSVGGDSWAEARAMREEILLRDPHYFG